MIRILVQVDTRHAASREMIAGVMRFAATHGDIEVQFSGAHPSSAPVEYFRSWKPDALIADATVHALSAQDFSVLSGRAVVFVNVTHLMTLFKKRVGMTMNAYRSADT